MTNLGSDGAVVQSWINAAEVPDDESLERNFRAWLFLANFSQDLDDTPDFELGRLVGDQAEKIEKRSVTRSKNTSWDKMDSS